MSAIFLVIQCVPVQIYIVISTDSHFGPANSYTMSATFTDIHCGPVQFYTMSVICADLLFGPVQFYTIPITLHNI